MKVGCAGILVADTVCGPLEQLPAEGQLITVDEMPVSAGGCAANVAVGLAKQGIEAEVIGCLGNDHAADVLIGCLTDDGINCDRIIRRAGYSTSTTVILLVRGQDRRYIHVFGANQALQVSDIPRDWVAGLDALYVGGLFAMPGIDLEELAALFEFCRDQNVLTVLDVVVPPDFQPDGSLPALLRHVDCFIPNDDEARIITGKMAATDQIRTLQEIGVQTVVITQGRNGAMVAQDGQIWKVGAYPIGVVDPSGSGDAFAAGMIMGLVNKWPMQQTLQYATALGASATTQRGTTAGVFTAEQASHFIAAHSLEVTPEVAERTNHHTV